MGTHERIAGPFRVESTSGGAQKDYVLSPTTGNSKFKTFLVSVKVLAVSSANTRVGATLQHSPDGEIWQDISATATIPLTAPGTPPDILVGLMDTTKEALEHVRVEINVDDNTASGTEWANVEVFLTRKLR